MKRVLTLVVVGIICAVFVACQPGAAGLPDQDKAAIRKVVEDGTRIVTSGKADYAAYVKLYYAEDATLADRRHGQAGPEGSSPARRAVAGLPVVCQWA